MDQDGGNGKDKTEEEKCEDGGNGKDKAEEEKCESKILEDAKAASTHGKSFKEIHAIPVLTVPTKPDAGSSSKEIHAIPVLTVPTKPDAGSSNAAAWSSALSLCKSVRFDYVWTTAFQCRWRVPRVRRVPIGPPMIPPRAPVAQTTTFTLPIKLEVNISFRIPFTVLLALVGLIIPRDGATSVKPALKPALKHLGTSWRTALICVVIGLFLHGAWASDNEGSDDIFVRAPRQPGTFVQVTAGVGRYVDVFMRV